MLTRNVDQILVPFDGSKNSLRALNISIYIAKKCQAVITGIYVMPMSLISAIHPAGFIPPVSTAKVIDITRNLSKEAEGFMKDAKTRSAKKGILFKFKILQGQPGSDIVKFANNKKNKIDLIVMGSRGRSKLKELFFGSTSNFVVHKSKVPVLIIK